MADERENLNGEQEPIDNDVRSIHDIIPVEDSSLIDELTAEAQPTHNENSDINFANLVVKDIMGNEDVDFSNEPLERQVEIVKHSFEDVINHYEGKLAEVQQYLPNEYELQLLQAMREGINPFEQSGPTVDVNNRDEVVRMKLKNDNPGWEDADIEAELNDIKNANKLERYYKSALPLIEQQKQAGSNSWQEYQNSLMQQRQMAEQQEYENDVRAIAEVAQNTNEFSGFELPTEVRQRAFQYATQVNPETGNPYLVDSLNDPARVYRLAVLDLYFEQFVSAIEANQVAKVQQHLSPNPPSLGGQSFASHKEDTTEDLAAIAERMSKTNHLGTV